MSDSGEVRHTDPVTGAQKGKKPSQIGALDPLAILAVGEVAGFGAEKYDRFNFLKGFPYHWSYDALQRHINLFWAGEDVDEESGLSHMAHAAWQCLALLSFELRDRGTDDRPHVALEKVDAEIASKSALARLFAEPSIFVDEPVSNPTRTLAPDWIPTEEM